MMPSTVVSTIAFKPYGRLFGVPALGDVARYLGIAAESVQKWG
jgi:hypothetical protein